MMKSRLAALALLMTGLVCLGEVVRADTKYWDINNATPGAGGASPAGTWDTTTSNWTTDSTGSIAGTTWASGDTAVFSAGNDATGSYIVTLGAAQTAAGLTIEEGTVILAGPALTTNAGPIMVNSGATLVTPNSTSIATTAGSVYTLNGGTLRTTNSGAGGSFVDVDSTIFLGSGGGTIDYQVPNVLNIIQTTTVISGSGSLTKTGVGVLALASPSTYAGDTIINDGELRLRGGTNRLPTTTNVIVNGNGILNLNGSAQNQTIASLSGDGSVGLSGGTLTINGSASTTFSGSIKNVANAGAGGATTGNGRITKDGSGTLTLTGVSDFKGRTTVVNGEIIVAPGAVLCDPIADLYVDGGKITFNNTAQTVENLNTTTSGVSTGVLMLGNGHTLTTDPAASTTFAAKISGSGNLVKANVLSGATVRTLTLTGANDFTGTTTIAGGKIAVGHASALGTTAGDTTVAAGAELLFDGAAVNFTVAEPLKIAGGGAGGGGAITIQSSATPTLSGPITLTDNATVTVSSTATGVFSNPNAFTAQSNQSLTLQGGSGAGGGGTISGAIALGSGGLTKLQGGKWVLSAVNSYDGATTVSAGTLVAASDGALGSAVGATSVASGASLGFQGNVSYATSESVSIAGTGVSSSGAIANLSGHNAFAGPVTLTADSSIGVVTGSSLTLNNSIGGSFGLTKTGAGALTLAGPGGSSYDGPTVITSGTLFANNASGSATGSGAVTVDTAGTLAGSGAVSGTVLVNGILSPGNSIESLSGGSLTLAGTSTSILELDSSGVPLSAAADLMNVTGSLTIDAGAKLTLVDVALVSAPFAPGTKFTLFRYDASGWNGGTFDGLPDDSVVTVGATMFTLNYNDLAAGVNFGGGAGGGHYVTLTAVPEASAVLFGSAVALVGGTTMLVRRRRPRAG